MHWSLVVLVVVTTLLAVGAVVFMAVMWSNRSTEMGRLAGQQHHDPLLLSNSELNAPPRLQIRPMGTEYERRLHDMSGDELAAELQQIIVRGQPLSSSPEVDHDVHAHQVLAHLVQATQPDVEQQAYGVGQGIVICAGGFEYGTSAYVLLRLLRQQGCTLPVELWHRQHELQEPEFRTLFETLGPIELRDIDAVASITFANKYAIKPLSVYYSRFRQVLLLDADNLTVRDPTRLFEQATWLDADPDGTSAYFWPDYWRLDTKALCWSCLTPTQRERMTYQYTQDSGQVLLDKKHCMVALGLCCRINVQLATQLSRLFPPPFNHGDKDTWHFSWLATEQPFRMLTDPRPGGAGALDQTGAFTGTTIVQHDLQGERLLLHKWQAKWATQTQRPQWTEIRGFLDASRGSVNQWTYDFEDGNVTSLPFHEEYDQLEEDCWDALAFIRHQPWYQDAFKQELTDLGLC